MRMIELNGVKGVLQRSEVLLDRRKSNLKLIKIIIKKRTEMRKNDKNNLRKSLEGARKYVGSDVREGRLKHTRFDTKLLTTKK